MDQQSFLQIEQAARGGDGFALALMGQTLVDLHPSREAAEQGAQLIEVAAQAKNVLWAKCLRRYLRSPEGAELPVADHAPVDADAMMQLRIHADEGNMWAQAVLDHLLHEGRVAVQQRPLAARLLGQAARGGCLWAQELMSLYGIGPTSEGDEPFRYRLADRNNSKYWIK